MNFNMATACAEPYEEARYAATLRVVVEKPLTGRSYQLSSRFFQRRINGRSHSVFTQTLCSFLTISTNISKNRELEPHQFLVLNFGIFLLEMCANPKNTVK
jgi:hypothetical protein